VLPDGVVELRRERMVVGVVELDGAPDRALYVGFSRP
jgi:hypothetical protein